MNNQNEFPITWDNPAQAKLSWFFDTVHFPDQVTPLDYHLLIRMMGDGINHASKIYDVGFIEHYQHINTYIYDGPEFSATSAEEIMTLRLQSQQKLDIAISCLDQRWKEEWLPEIKRHINYWETFNYSQASMTELIEHLSESISRFQRMWEIHFLLFWPMVLVLSDFERLIEDLPKADEDFNVYELLGGFSNKTIAGNQVLWQLSRKALDSVIIKSILTDNIASQVIQRLTESNEGQFFLDEFNTYLQEYGKQADKPILSQPSWLEDPTPAIKNLQNYINQPDNDMPAKMAKAAKRREQLVIKVYQALEDYPKLISDKFKHLLNVAQVSYVLSEDHHFWIDCQVSYHAREISLEFGRRLTVNEVIDNQNDIFYLTLPEIKSTAMIPSSLHALVDERRRQEKRFSGITPPPCIGAPFSEEIFDNPLFRALDKFFGVMHSPTKNNNELKGYAGSPGIVQGTARIIHHLDDAEKCQPNDILVTKTTAPSWTSLFTSIAGIVTNSGGTLCHSAIVAREYGIPAVVGTGIATTTIREGQKIEVNGNTGMVYLL